MSDLPWVKWSEKSPDEHEGHQVLAVVPDPLNPVEDFRFIYRFVIFHEEESGEKRWLYEHSYGPIDPRDLAAMCWLEITPPKGAKP